MRKMKAKLSPLGLNRDIDYKDLLLLRSFTTSYGKILGRRVSNLTKIQQSRLKKAIKHARLLGLFPFVPNKAL
ncbi:30S ribosomal protein S18 (chloroplast) [Nannochloropsis gaditana]|jgi:ribosomal protein S18|uniref:Small ribosomal subunit protein bS18c n=3 Tax=Monodopsidaceae TaxID=425072 RepID=K9ZV97_9STRA|nr:30S ribosomal protein S18 [Nannochloropsis gaditana]YP_008519833.1 ribosomal protein S18 [Microchloropsis salina]YP_008519957.1 ribosomal protein S18 [Nannochloropsis limnetica]AFZ64309.1 30S ribosomal protein S18 [Nannochloropsis gaditana]AGI98687.1 ribosomal protein S18 [Nannochloropsis gaditana]AGI99187.1 ribosomal protein S18 [Microchloropsis salina]AGI99313.1 ribosomal protein S18 [Nannochloropsis limnetica]AHX25083.1 30S ribosomal protein S18 [Nannochloropsis gaditana]